ncbi:MAG TPA: hypothetical protein VHM94_01435 [Acidimicrobiia bacterium]|jgi:hypothetical protein|nr:hypothetical protein [Acidimicrobiia bacterium]
MTSGGVRGGRVTSFLLVTALLVLVCWMPHPGEASEGDGGMLGYIGCSMTRDTFLGYHQVGATLAWPVGTYILSEGVLGAWVVRGSRWRGDARRNLEGYVQKRNAQPPDAVLIMVCLNKKTTPNISTMQAVVGNIAHYSPGVPVYVTSQPRYTAGHLCQNLATSLEHQEARYALIDQIISQTIANGWARSGPVMPVLSPSQLRDSCHGNSTGQVVLGQAVIDWWG